MVDGHTPQYYDYRERLIDNFAEFGFRYLLILSKKERQYLYEIMDVKTASGALRYRLYHKYFKE